jgi:hypothetical protein
LNTFFGRCNDIDVFTTQISILHQSHTKLATNQIQLQDHICPIIST